MKTIYDWLEAYGESHQNLTNKKIHWFCVPVIMVTLLGLLSLVKFYNINLAYGLIFLALIFYLKLSASISIGMFLISAIQLVIIYYLEQALSVSVLLYIYIGFFIVAWIGQFIGHKIEGKKPSFFEDLQFLLIGPAWLLSFIYNKIGIKY